MTLWLNAAGEKALDRVATTELLAKLARAEKDSKEYTKILNRICEGNLLLVYKTTEAFAKKRLIKWGGPLSVDLLQVGFLGLRHAVTRYDASRGTVLSTVAVPWIRQKLGRHMNKCEQSVYVPENLVNEVSYFKKHGEVSNRKTAPKNHQLVHIAAYACANPLSLDMPMGEDGTATFADSIESPDRSNTYHLTEKKLLEIRDLMAQAMIEPRVQDFVMEYARTGVVSVAAYRSQLKTSNPSRVLRTAIEKIQSVLV